MVLPLRVVEVDGFHLPRGAAASATPLVFVALGSGVAPMFAFLRQLAHERAAAAAADAPAARPTLVWGLRSPEHLHDQEELLAFVETLGLDLLVCFSQSDSELVVRTDAAGRARTAVVPGTRKRITTGLALGAWPTKLGELVERGAVFFLCGHPSLRDSFRAALENALAVHGDCSAREASLCYERLCAQRRVRADLYFSGGAAHDADAETFTHARVARHHELDDLFVIYKGDVFDLTSYAVSHPGGAKILYDKAGRDCTEDFAVAHGAGNVRVERQMAPLRVGRVARPAPACPDGLRQAFEASVAWLDHAWEVRNAYRCDVNADFPGEAELWGIAHSRCHRHVSACKFWRAALGALEAGARAFGERVAAAVDDESAAASALRALDVSDLVASAAREAAAVGLAGGGAAPSASELAIADSRCRLALACLTGVADALTEAVDAIEVSIVRSARLPTDDSPLVAARVSARSLLEETASATLRLVRGAAAPPAPERVLVGGLAPRAEAREECDWLWAARRLSARCAPLRASLLGGPHADRRAAAAQLLTRVRRLARVDVVLCEGEITDHLVLIEAGEVTTARRGGGEDSVGIHVRGSVLCGLGACDDGAAVLGFHRATCTARVSSESAVIWVVPTSLLPVEAGVVLAEPREATPSRRAARHTRFRRIRGRGRSPVARISASNSPRL